MEKIFYNNTLIAIRLKRFKKGTVSLTDPPEPLQVLAFKHSKGKYTKEHIHIPRQRITQKLQECLVVLKGRIKIDLYGPDKKFFKSIYVSPLQVVIFMNGGHGIHVLKDSEIIEIKNGPFVEDKMVIGYE